MTPILFLVINAIRLEVPMLLIGSFLFTIAVSALHISLWGDSVLIDRSMLGNLGFYLLGMAIALRHTDYCKFSSFGKQIFLILAFSILAWLLVAYNLLAQMPRLWAGCFVSIIFSFIVLTHSKELFGSANTQLRNLGKLTYQIYVFHGLFLFIYSQYLELHNPYYAIVLLFALPIIAATTYQHLLLRFETCKIAKVV